MKRYNVIQGSKVSYLEVESDSGKKYYITPWINPLFTYIELNDQHSTQSWKSSLPHQILWTCSCNDFILGKARRGENPFANPCKHIKEMLVDTGSIKTKLEDLLNADKGLAGGASEKKAKKEKGNGKN